MKSNFSYIVIIVIFTVFSTQSLFAQPGNNTCVTAVLLPVGTSCTTTAGTLYQSTSTTPTGGCGSRKDVWYKFIVPSGSVTISTVVNPLSNLNSANSFVELFSAGSCPVDGTSTGGCNAVSTAATYSGLTAGNTYYFRLYTTVTTPNNLATFTVCLTTPAGSRMNEVFKQTVLAPANVLNYPWEVIYGPDDSLYITESKSYKIQKYNPVTGGFRTILDISQGSSFLPVADRGFNCQFSNGSGAQGGLAGMALHPKFLDPVAPQNYIYVSYIYSSNGGSSPTGVFYTNRLVRFTYNTSTGKLDSPVSLCDTLPGSSDHNSQRIIIAPVGGTDYLFYAGGDMGAGQFGNRDRLNRAQITGSYEGKILRFNLAPDGDAGLAAWIPNTNPYSSTSAVWCIGIRNNQGFAYDRDLDILYGSMHGPYSDDEINIIQPFKNYGHPLVIGYVDGNYNGNSIAGTNTSVSAGAPFTDNSGNSACPPVGNEVTRLNELNAAAATRGAYKSPLFSAYPTDNATIKNTWKNNTGNANWYSEAWSGLDLYTGTAIPGWKKSLLAASLKWGRIIRLKLGPTGTTTMPSNLDSANTSDTVIYFQSTNRYRDLAFAPNGKDIFLIMDNSSATSGPGVGNPTVPGCQGCLVKYSFLGYADEGGLSSIPKTIDVTDNAVNTCNTGTSITIDNSNNFLWVPITGPDGNIMAEINAMGQNLGVVTSSVYQNSGAIRSYGGIKYLDRNITITPTVTVFANPVKVRLYISKNEFDALKANPQANISNINQLKVFKNSDACGAAVNSTTSTLTPTNTALADMQQGANAYVMQVDVSGFSTFYFGANNLSLPLHLLSFTGSLQNNAMATLLNWKTDNEVNTAQFVLERSADARDFVQITTVVAAGNTSTQSNYSYTDKDVTALASDNVYYRLKMVDIDGKFTYSDIVRVTLPSIKSTITISPNPASKQLTVKVTTSAAVSALWTIVDVTGRVLMNNAAELNKGENAVTINISALAAGAYYLKITGTGVESKTQFQKL